MKSNQEFRADSLAQSYAQACASPAPEEANETHNFAADAKRDYSQKVPNDDPLGTPMTIREVALLLGCSIWTVRQRHLRGGLPFFRIGAGKLLFYRKQVVQWILESQKKERR
jgi:excisionase family DNA binding protein